MIRPRISNLNVQQWDSFEGYQRQTLEFYAKDYFPHPFHRESKQQKSDVSLEIRISEKRYAFSRKRYFCTPRESLFGRKITLLFPTRRVVLVWLYMQITLQSSWIVGPLGRWDSGSAKNNNNRKRALAGMYRRFRNNNALFWIIGGDSSKRESFPVNDLGMFRARNIPFTYRKYRVFCLKIEEKLPSVRRGEYIRQLRDANRLHACGNPTRVRALEKSTHLFGFWWKYIGIIYISKRSQVQEEQTARYAYYSRMTYFVWNITLHWFWIIFHIYILYKYKHNCDYWFNIYNKQENASITRKETVWEHLNPK